LAGVQDWTSQLGERIIIMEKSQGFRIIPYIHGGPQAAGAAYPCMFAIAMVHHQGYKPGCRGDTRLALQAACHQDSGRGSSPVQNDPALANFPTAHYPRFGSVPGAGDTGRALPVKQTPAPSLRRSDSDSPRTRASWRPGAPIPPDRGSGASREPFDALAIVPAPAWANARPLFPRMQSRPGMGITYISGGSPYLPLRGYGSHRP